MTACYQAIIAMERLCKEARDSFPTGKVPEPACHAILLRMLIGTGTTFFNVVKHSRKANSLCFVCPFIFRF